MKEVRDNEEGVIRGSNTAKDTEKKRKVEGEKKHEKDAITTF